MKANLAFLLLLVFSFSCSHHKKKDSKPKYNPEVSYQMDDKNFEAKVHLPEKFEDKIPLVVMVHEWWGRTPNMMEQSEKLNEAGYATLPVDLYGNGKTVSTPKEAQEMATPFYQNPEMGVRRIAKFVEMAKKDPHVDPNQIYVIGYCFGGTQALNYARSGADIAGVASFHGGLSTSMPQKPIKARVLAMNGLADPMVPAKDRKAFEKEMKNIKADYKIVNYKNAKHAFTNPKATEMGKKFKLPIAYNEKAAKASFQELLDFINKKK